MTRRVLGLSASLFLLGCASTGGGLQAQERSSHAEPGVTAHSEEHGAGSQAWNLFVGGSNEIGDREGYAFGLDYEYRLTQAWGMGAFAEAVTGLDRSFATGLQLSWHCYRELVLVAGPGLERHNDEWEPITRVGAFYEFPANGGWVLSPAVFYDFTQGEDLLIYGLNVGRSW